MSRDRIRTSPTTTHAMRYCCALFGVLLCQAVAAGEELIGTATHVFDGDSFIVRLADGTDIEVRLGGIDAPEKEQPHADAARAALRDMILDQRVRIVVLDTDQYDRTVARVYRIADGIDINAELVSCGHAWVYRRRARDKSLYELERAARERRLGLWALPEAARTPPWRWRRAHPRESGSDQKVDRPVASISL